MLTAPNVAAVDTVVDNNPTSLDGALFRVLALIIWTACVMPTALLLIIEGRTWGEATTYNYPTQTLRHTLLAVALFWSAIILSGWARGLARRPFGIIILLTLALFYPAASLYFRGEDSADETFAAVASLIVMLAVFSLRLTLTDLRIIGVLGAMTGAVSLGMAGITPQSAYSLDVDGQVLAGPFDNINYLGTILVTCLPFALMLRRPLVRATALVLIAWPILIGGSMTSIVALAAVVVFGLSLLIVKARRTRVVLVGVASAVALLTTALLPFLVNDAAAFTQRGVIWLTARSHILEFVPFGAGARWFDENSAYAGFSLDHAHNILLDPLIVGGLPFLGLTLVFLFYMFRLGLGVMGRGGSIAPSLYVLILVIIGSVGNFFILDLRDLRFFATGLAIITLLSIATSRQSFLR